MNKLVLMQSSPFKEKARIGYVTTLCYLNRLTQEVSEIEYYWYPTLEHKTPTKFKSFRELNQFMDDGMEYHLNAFENQ